MCLKSHEERFDKVCMFSRQKKKYCLFVDLFSEAFNTNIPYLSYIILIQILNLKTNCAVFLLCGFFLSLLNVFSSRTNSVAGL